MAQILVFIHFARRLASHSRTGQQVNRDMNGYSSENINCFVRKPLVFQVFHINTLIISKIKISLRPVSETTPRLPQIRESDLHQHLRF
jgi:hypothetical protein